MFINSAYPLLLLHPVIAIRAQGQFTVQCLLISKTLHLVLVGKWHIIKHGYTSTSVQLVREDKI